MTIDLAVLQALLKYNKVPLNKGLGLLFHPCDPASDNERLRNNRLIIFLSSHKVFGVYWSFTYTATPEHLVSIIVENQSIAIDHHPRLLWLPESAIAYLDPKL